jgi:antibiotic biosynthesis monooxygenase (ABM) superfamily enzyme
VAIFRFDNYANLHLWENSAERATWLEQAKDLFDTAPQFQENSGLEYWFTLPPETTNETKPATPRPAPPRYKMAMITMLAIYPVSTILNFLLGLVIVDIHPLLRSFIVILLAIILLTYLVMPRLTKLFAPWLFKTKATQRK